MLKPKVSNQTRRCFQLISINLHVVTVYIDVNPFLTIIRGDDSVSHHEINNNNGAVKLEGIRYHNLLQLKSTNINLNQLAKEKMHNRM